jgi:hypothetical protein
MKRLLAKRIWFILLLVLGVALSGCGLYSNGHKKDRSDYKYKDGALAEAPITITGGGAAYQIGLHDSTNRFCYDGSCVLDGKGKIYISLDPEKGTGQITAKFTGPEGKWVIKADKFKLIKTDVALHGRTGGDVQKEFSPPLLPEVWTYVATWGPGTAWLDGVKQWTGPTHLMITEEVRDPVTKKVDFKGPKMVGEYPGSVYNKHGVQVHFVSHPEEKPTKGYLPPFTKFIHIMWEEIVWD